MPDGQVFTQPWPAGRADRRRDQVIYYQYKADRARRATCPDGTPVTAEFVIDAYHRLFQIEKAFRMSKHDLQARPIYHHQRDSIDAHLTIVFAALAVSRWIEDRTGWSIKKFVRTARRYRTIEIQAGDHTNTAADPLPDEFREALEAIHPTCALT